MRAPRPRAAPEPWILSPPPRCWVCWASLWPGPQQHKTSALFFAQEKSWAPNRFPISPPFGPRLEINFFSDAAICLPRPSRVQIAKPGPRLCACPNFLILFGCSGGNRQPRFLITPVFPAWPVSTIPLFPPPPLPRGFGVKIFCPPFARKRRPLLLPIMPRALLRGSHPCPRLGVNFPAWPGPFREPPRGSPPVRNLNGPGPVLVRRPNHPLLVPSPLPEKALGPPTFGAPLPPLLPVFSTILAPEAKSCPVSTNA